MPALSRAFGIPAYGDLVTPPGVERKLSPRAMRLALPNSAGCGLKSALAGPALGAGDAERAGRVGSSLLAAIGSPQPMQKPNSPSSIPFRGRQDQRSSPLPPARDRSRYCLIGNGGPGVPPAAAGGSAPPGCLDRIKPEARRERGDERAASHGLPRGGEECVDEAEGQRAAILPHAGKGAGILVRGCSRRPRGIAQRNSMIGILHERIISVVVEPMIRLRMREWP